MDESLPPPRPPGMVTPYSFPAERRISRPAQVADEVVDPLAVHGHPQVVVRPCDRDSGGKRLHELDLNGASDADLHVLVLTAPSHLHGISVAVGSVH